MIYIFTFLSLHGNLQYIFYPQNGLWTALPYIVMWFVSIGSGLLCDKLITWGYLSTTTARKVFTTIGRCNKKESVSLNLYHNYLTVG